MDTRIKLQPAGRAFLARLIELHGLKGAARVLRTLLAHHREVAVSDPRYQPLDGSRALSRFFELREAHRHAFTISYAVGGPAGVGAGMNSIPCRWPIAGTLAKSSGTVRTSRFRSSKNAEE